MKKARQAKILELITNEAIATQEGLILRLKALGFDVTQATVSRDIRELKLVKALTPDGSYKYVCASRHNVPHRLQLILSDCIVKTDHAMNFVVLGCHTGMANAACAALDQMQFDNIVGTIAGDDTIFILMRCEADAAAMLQEINQLIQRA